MKQISITHDLSNIIWLCPSFAAQSTPILVCALITSCIDYCNLIFSGLPQKFLHSFHTVDRVKTKISFRTSYSCVSDSSLAYFKILHKCVRLCILLIVLSILLLSTEHCHPSHTLWFFSTIILIIPPAHLTTIGLEFSAMWPLVLGNPKTTFATLILFLSLKSAFQFDYVLGFTGFFFFFIC